MSANSQEQEIDLGQLSKKIGGYFQKVIDSIFDFILFIKRNIIIIAVLFILGVVLGYILDKKTKVYNHEIVVLPNFNSVDYLYSKIKLINAKKIENDTLFLKSIGIKEPKKLALIEIEPIVDIYDFVRGSETNLELIKLMAEDGDLEKIIENETTAKNYEYHLVKIKTTKSINKKDLIDPILKYLQESNYFSELKKAAQVSLDNEIKSNDETLKQINDILNELPKQSGKSTSVYISENNQLNEIINSKEDLINKQSYNRIRLINYQNIIKEVTSTLNIKNTKGTNGKLKIVFPILFVFLFMVMVYSRKFYKRQMLKRNLV